MQVFERQVVRLPLLLCIAAFNKEIFGLLVP